MDDAFGHWLAGFIDGEGSFSIARQKRNGYYTYAPNFQLKVRIDDREIVERIEREAGFGWPCYPKRRELGNTQAQIGWGVTSKADCVRLVELLDRFPLRAKKARDYAIWREAVLAYAATIRSRNGAVSGHADWSALETARAELVEVRRFREPLALVA